MMVVVTINPEKERRDGRALQENKKQKTKKMLDDIKRMTTRKKAKKIKILTTVRRAHWDLNPNERVHAGAQP